MKLPSTLAVLRCLIWDTFAQSLSSGLFWLVLGISGVAILVCLSAGVTGAGANLDLQDNEFLPRNDPQAGKAREPGSGITIAEGDFTLAFGALRFPIHRDITSAVRFLEMLLAAGIADTFGVLLALIWTAGFMPRFLDPALAPQVLSKPVSPWCFVAGKYLGAVMFVAFQAAVFFGGTWLALGCRTGVWDAHYMLCLPIMLLHFAVFYTVSMFLAVVTRSTVACVVGTIVFWFLCWGMNYGHHLLHALPPQQMPSPVLMNLAELSYWILPKPADFGMLLFDCLQANAYFNTFPEFQLLEKSGAFHPALSLLSSILFGLVVLVLNAYEFARRDF